MLGQYVRMVIAPNTRMGTITDKKVEGARVEYLFHHDPRFDDRLPDCWVPPSDIEPCDRPTDSQVAAINALAKYGSR
jgi:hypothetical protein